MNEAFLAKLNAKLEAYREWRAGRDVQAARLVQYCGVELVGALDIPVGDVESRIEGLVCEGFYVDWAEHERRLIVRVWEFDGPEPDWPSVWAERALQNPA